jgi:hypothetical protein
MTLIKNSIEVDFVQAEKNLFPELATPLFYFIEKLYAALIEQGDKHVYFLAREGQPLKRMFDMYQDKVGGHIKSHYLEVSRRSTLLPSLASLAEENFETLFRQYRRISLFEFLSSLGLEAWAKNIALAIGLQNGEEVLREEDFPTSLTFNSIKKLQLFRELYESERIERRLAFISYLTQMSGEILPTTMVVVDVGWKGTIQDNLFALLCKNGNRRVKKLSGYYLGLVAAGAANPCNQKIGLLFSVVGDPTPKFRIFNENRTLFEVLLAADHGSIVSYETTADGRASAIRGEFEEGDMLANKVFPLQHQLFKNFYDLTSRISPSSKGCALPFRDVVRAHARMVFNPTSDERAWFLSVFHVENYGVFERSYFAKQKNKSEFFQRLYFIKNLLQRRDVGGLGFWPWSTIFEQGGALPAALYAAVRRLQR